MNGVMAKPRKNKPRGRPRKYKTESTEAPRSGKVVHAYIAPELYAALQRFVDASELKPSKTTIIEIALREYLERRKSWPPESI